MKSCIVYPVLQKYYICMQNSFKSASQKAHYEQKRDKHLMSDSMKWFNGKRVSTIHKEPFKLEKRVLIDLLYSGGFKNISDERLTTDSDGNITSILGAVKETFQEYSKYSDVYFSVSFTLLENGEEKDIYKAICDGLLVMDGFVNELSNDYPCACGKCDALKEKLGKAKNRVIGKEMTFIWDYSLVNGELEQGGTGGMYFSDEAGHMIPASKYRNQLAGLPYEPKSGCDLEVFQFFESVFEA